MRSIGVWLVVASSITVTGCGAVLYGSPDTSRPSSENLRESVLFIPDSVASSYYSETNDSGRVAVLDKFFRERLSEIDYNFEIFTENLKKGDTLSSLASSAAVIGISGLIASGVSEGLAQSLGAASAGIAGYKATFDKEAFFDRTVDVWVKQMEAHRDAVRARITQRLADLSTGKAYPLIAVQGDLQDYWTAGTLIGAVNATSDDAAATQTNADQAMQQAVFTVNLSDKGKELTLWLKGGVQKDPYIATRVSFLVACMKENNITYPDGSEPNFAATGKNSINLNKFLAEDGREAQYSELLTCSKGKSEAS